jgi:hypothetical protein
MAAAEAPVPAALRIFWREKISVRIIVAAKVFHHRLIEKNGL